MPKLFAIHHDKIL